MLSYYKDNRKFWQDAGEDKKFEMSYCMVFEQLRMSNLEDIYRVEGSYTKFYVSWTV